MDTLSVENLEFQGSMYPRWLTFEYLKPFSYDFTFGRSYLLASSPGTGAEALSFLVGGRLQPHSGTIKRNGVEYTQADRKRDAWIIWLDQINRFGVWNNQTVGWQIRHGLRTFNNGVFHTEAEVIERFLLTEERYNRSLRQLSHERWRASCAIGFVHGKRIFCFPHINQYEHQFIEHYFDAYLKGMIDLLRDCGALVLIPAILTPLADKLCDEVVLINKGLQ
jgi:ABC-type multidrug transport system ATPase subunit